MKTHLASGRVATVHALMNHTMGMSEPFSPTASREPVSVGDDVERLPFLPVQCVAPATLTAGSPFAEQFARALAERDCAELASALASPFELFFALSQGAVAYYWKQVAGWGQVVVMNQQRATQALLGPFSGHKRAPDDWRYTA